MDWDCIVVGGGAAGLSAALVLGRARQRTLVVDAGEQSNRPAHGIGGLLGQDGRPPDAFYAAGREELAAYPSVELRSGEVVGGERRDGGVVLELAGGGREASATGAARDRHGLPAPGAARDRGALGPFCLPLPVLPRLGGDGTGCSGCSIAATPGCSGRCCSESGAMT